MAGIVDQHSRRKVLSIVDGIDAPDRRDVDVPDSLNLQLTVEDRDTIDDLLAYPAGDERDQFALNALRIGVLALRQTRGRVDADLIQRETQRMLNGLAGQLSAHAVQMQDKLAASLKEYFDPQSGRLHERVQQLIKQDGELEQVLRRQIGAEDSELCKTLLGHFGQQSPLMKLLNPSESEGLLMALRQTVESQLTAQRDHVLKEFSLDNKEGALARMIGELTTSHGQLTDALQKKIDMVVGEFSLDKEDSALNRLVRNVDRAQSTITREFSLDDDDSSLARLKRELLGVLEKHTKANSEFQEEVKVALGKMVARREEAQRSTQHGLVFEDAVCQYLEYHSQQTGDIATRSGATTGLIKNCKVGDCILELGPDSAAPSAKVVVEAKERASCTLAEARAEIETARKNRDAQVGLFIFSKTTAPDGADEVHRIGHDVFVVWDPEDATTNLHLKIGLTLARALCIRVEQHSQSQEADYEAITKAILEIEKQSQFLGEITASAETIKSGADKVLERVRKTRSSLERQVEILQARIGDLKHSAGGQTAN
ncbi:MAG TPA: hypothetical protein VGZ26_07715 [Pirellulales bacterium]|jgi:hypothetical protein|nr:hypothetical protein [Pirellulales bacterium]